MFVFQRNYTAVSKIQKAVDAQINITRAGLEPNCSCSSNFRNHWKLRSMLNWIWVTYFRQECVLFLIRGNTCAKHPWMGQTQSYWIKIRKPHLHQRHYAVHITKSHDRSFKSWVTTRKNNVSDPTWSWGELPFFIWRRGSGWPVRKDMLCYFCSVVFKSRARV